MGRKRKDSSLIPNHKRPSVTCRICKAPATGFHYGIDACGACKGFFYRSINQNIHYRCEKDNNCTIDFKSVKFCQKCRYAKCLAYGMSKTASKIGRYPSFKKTEELLERLGISRNGTVPSSQRDVDATLPPLSAIEPSPAKRPCSRLQNSVDTLPDSTDHILFHTSTPSGTKDSLSPFFSLLPQSDYSSLSSSTASSVFDLSLRPGRNDYTFLTTPPESNNSNPCTPMDIGTSDAPSPQSESTSPTLISTVWQNTDSTTISDSTVDSSSKHNSPSLYVSWHHNNNNNNYNSNNNNNSTKTHIQHCSPPLARTQKFISWDTPSGPGDQSESFTHKSLSESPVQEHGLPSAVSSSGTCLSSVELLDPSPIESDSSEDNKINQELPDLASLSLVDESTAEALEKISDLYADPDAIVQKFLEAERNTLRFKARDLSPKELYNEQLNHREACICRHKMFGRKTFLQESEYEDFLKKTGLDIDDRQEYVSKKLSLLEDTIMGIATFAKTIPGFKYVPMEQKARLIKYSRWDVCVVSAIQISNADLMVSLSRHKGWVCPLDYDEDAASSVMLPAIKLMGRIQKLDLTDEELVVIMAIAISSPDRAEPTNSLLVTCIHAHLVDILMKLLKRNHDNPMILFASIVSMLTELRSLEANAASRFLKGLNNVVQAELRERPLAKEMIPTIRG